MLADLTIRQVRTELGSWSQESAPDLQAWQEQETALQKALSLKPNDADSYRLLGYLYEWQERITDDTSSRSDAVAAYRQAASFRPGWPDDWVRLARMKAINGELDDEYSLALNRAFVLGMNEARIEVELFYAISLGWRTLDLTTDIANLLDDFVSKSLLAGGRYREKLDYLNTSGLLTAYCIQLDVEKKLENAPGEVKARCQSLGIPAEE
jgi:tetratricopeptide (TPR) repeat protein